MPRRSRRAKKQRVEKRRKTRRSQRGGEPNDEYGSSAYDNQSSAYSNQSSAYGNPSSAYDNNDSSRVKSVAEWVQRVLKTAPFIKQDQPEYQKNPNADDQYSLGAYSIESLKEQGLVMPAPKIENNQFTPNPEFNLGDYDARILALSLRAALNSVIPNHLKPGEFRLYIKNLKEIDLQDESVLNPQMIQLAELVECELKALAGEGSQPRCDSNTVLTDAANYPLLLLSLLANTPITDPPPILLSAKEGKSFTESESRVSSQQEEQPM